MTDLSDFDDRRVTEVSASSPLVDYGNNEDHAEKVTCTTVSVRPPDNREVTGPTAEIDMRTTPATRKALEIRRTADGRFVPPAFARPQPPLGDMKAGLTSDRPKLSIVPAAGELYQCRAMEYGAEKYRRGNYHGAPPEGVDKASRVMGYVDAGMRHLRAIADAYNKAVGLCDDDPKHALACPDTVASSGFPPSGLPHLAHALASISLAVQCGVDDGLLPADPGQPWRSGAVRETRSPEAAARLEREPVPTRVVGERETFRADGSPLTD